jgi:lysophospholipase L1-like esterase
VYEPKSGVWLRTVRTAGSPGVTSYSGRWPREAVVLTLQANRDGLPDAVLYDPDTGEWTLALNGGSSYSLTSGQWATGWEIRRADFNQDGVDDLVLYHRDTGAWLSQIGDGAGGFAGVMGTGPTQRDLLVDDFSGDGISDVLAYDVEGGEYSLYLGRLEGVLALARQGRWIAGLKLFATRWNRDDRADLLLYDLVSGVAVRGVAIPDGSFEYHSSQWEPNLDVAVGDLDGNGASDVLLYDPYTGNWSMRLGSTDRGARVDGRWPSDLAVLVADLNGDGRADAVAHARESGAWTLMVNTGDGFATDVAGAVPPGGLLGVRLGDRLVPPLSGPSTAVGAPLLVSAPPGPGSPPSPPAPRTILGTPRIVAFGDSITFGTHSRLAVVGAPEHVTYPGTLESDLRGRYPGTPGIRVTNSGVAGELAIVGRDRIGVVLDQQRPHAVIILEGVNDINAGVPNNQIAGALRLMAERAQVRRVRPLLSTLTPVTSAHDPSGATRALVADLNARIKTIAGQLGIGPAIDVHDPLEEAGLLGADGLHPSDAGYEEMGHIYATEISGRFEARARAVIDD